MPSYLQKEIQALRMKRGIEKPKTGDGVEVCSQEECAQFLKMLENGEELPIQVSRSKENRTVFFRKLVHEENAQEPSDEEVMEYLAHRELKALEEISWHLNVIKTILLFAALGVTISASVFWAWLLISSIKKQETGLALVALVGLLIAIPLAIAAGGELRDTPSNKPKTD